MEGNKLWVGGWGLEGEDNKWFISRRCVTSGYQISQAS